MFLAQKCPFCFIWRPIFHISWPTLEKGLKIVWRKSKILKVYLKYTSQSSENQYITTYHQQDQVQLIIKLCPRAKGKGQKSTRSSPFWKRFVDPCSGGTRCGAWHGERNPTTGPGQEFLLEASDQALPLVEPAWGQRSAALIGWGQSWRGLIGQWVARSGKPIGRWGARGQWAVARGWQPVGLLETKSKNLLGQNLLHLKVKIICMLHLILSNPGKYKICDVKGSLLPSKAVICFYRRCLMLHFVAELCDFSRIMSWQSAAAIVKDWLGLEDAYFLN